MQINWRQVHFNEAHNYSGSMAISEHPCTHSSPNLKSTLRCDLLTVVGLGEGVGMQFLLYWYWSIILTRLLVYLQFWSESSIKIRNLLTHNWRKTKSKLLHTLAQAEFTICRKTTYNNSGMESTWVIKKKVLSPPSMIGDVPPVK